MAAVRHYLVTIEYIDKGKEPHKIQAKFSSLMLALTKTKATCLKDNVEEVTNIIIEEVD